MGALVLLCGIGGTWIYNNVSSAANELSGQEEFAFKTGIFADGPDERAVHPNDNAAVILKRAFDEWQQRRSLIADERWESYVKGQAGDDAKEIDAIMQPVAALIKEAGEKEHAQWRIDYSQFAFSSYPVWNAVTEGIETDLRLEPFNSDHTTLKRRLRVTDHILKSADPGSLRTAGSIRMSVLTHLSQALEETWRQHPATLEMWLKDIENSEMIDPIPVWRKTALLHLETWENYEKLSDEQKKIFAGIPRDHSSMIYASSSQILKFWNVAISNNEKAPQLEQVLYLGKKVEELRSKPEQTQLALLSLWNLELSKTGAGSIDWLLAEEQRQLTLQALDILIAYKSELPKTFSCVRQSVIGRKAFTYEKTEKGFRLYAVPSDTIPDVSSLKDVGMVYEFTTSR